MTRIVVYCCPICAAPVDQAHSLDQAPAAPRARLLHRAGAHCHYQTQDGRAVYVYDRSAAAPAPLFARKQGTAVAIGAD